MTKPVGIKLLSDKELVCRTQTGSQSCFAELVQRYTGRLYHFLRLKTPTVQDAEDLVQETFLKAYRNIDRYHPNWKFSTWIFTMAGRLSIDHHRRKQVREGTPLPPADPETPHQLVARQETAQRVWKMARNLKPAQYQALWLRYVEELSTRDIGRVMGKTDLQIRVLLHRARGRLAQEIIKQSPAAGEEPSVPVKETWSYL